MLLKWSVLLISCATCLTSTRSKLTKSTQPDSKLVEFTVGNITLNLVDWESDLAVMFYAPWCTHCKQLRVAMESIADLVASNTNLVVGEFDCEKSSAHTTVCEDMRISRYPSVYFVGYGDLNHARAFWGPRHRLGPRVATFSSALYAEAVYDWVRLLSFVSGLQRRWAAVKNVFTGGSSQPRRIDALRSQVQAADKKVRLYEREIEKHRAGELFDSLPDRGDPFPLMAALEPDAENLPLRLCVAEMAAEFCKHYGDEKYCQLMESCHELQLEPEVRAVNPFHLLLLMHQCDGLFPVSGVSTGGVSVREQTGLPRGVHLHDRRHRAGVQEGAADPVNTQIS